MAVWTPQTLNTFEAPLPARLATHHPQVRDTLPRVRWDNLETVVTT